MGPLLEFRLRAARPSGVDGRVTVRKGILPCAGWRSARAVGEPAGPAPWGVGLQCCVRASGGARPPRRPWCRCSRYQLCLSESGELLESSGFTAGFLSFPDAWE